MNIYINIKDGKPLYRQIMDQVKYLIASQRLRPGEELPTVRGLAQSLIVNPNTVARAYRELEQAGILTTRQGSGTFVSLDSTPFSREECRRILRERVYGLLTEAHHLGFELNETMELMKEVHLDMHADRKDLLSKEQ